MKFKIGDRVKVKPNPSTLHPYNLLDYTHGIGVIDCIDNHLTFPYGVRWGSRQSNVFSEDELEKVDLIKPIHSFTRLFEFPYSN